MYILTDPFTQKLVRAKSGPGGPLFAAEFGPTPDYFWLSNLVWVAKSGPGLLICTKRFLPCQVRIYNYDPSQYIKCYDPI